MFIKRSLEVALRKYLDQQSQYSNTLLLSGARQVGKSTLVKECLTDRTAIMLNLYEMTTLARQIDATESFEDFERLMKRELNFVPSQGTVLVFDEAQESKKIGQWIRFFKEKWEYQKVIVLGSILSNLVEEEVSYPVGRVEELVLRPFSFKEYLLAASRQGLIESLDDSEIDKPFFEKEAESFIKPYLSYLRTGGMPEIAIEHLQNGNEDIYPMIDKFLGQYAMDIERHMKEIYKTMFISAMDRIADITCHPIKNSQIISTNSVSYRKLPKLLEIMEKWHLIHKVVAQTKQPESSGGIASKRYLFDVGFVNFFLNHGLPVEWVKRSGSGNIVFGKLQENFVCNELIAMKPASTTMFNYYKETKNSREIDFIVALKNTAIPIEVKSQASISRNSLMPMISFLEQNGLKVGILIYNGKIGSIKIKGKKIYTIPAFYVGELENKIEQMLI